LEAANELARSAIGGPEAIQHHIGNPQPQRPDDRAINPPISPAQILPSAAIAPFEEIGNIDYVTGTVGHHDIPAMNIMGKQAPRSGVVEGMVNVVDRLRGNALAVVEAVVKGNAMEAFENQEIGAFIVAFGKGGVVAEAAVNSFFVFDTGPIGRVNFDDHFRKIGMGEDGGVVATAQDLPWCGQILHDDGINGTHTSDVEFREEAVMNLIREGVIEHKPLGECIAAQSKYTRSGQYSESIDLIPLS
jgi:hypothetical protein